MPQCDIHIPQCEKGIGDVILAPDSPKLIAGVKCAPIALWPDDRGYFLEVQRIGQGLARALPQRNHPDFRRAQLPRNHQGLPLSPPSDGLLDARP